MKNVLSSNTQKFYCFLVWALALVFLLAPFMLLDVDPHNGFRLGAGLMGCFILLWWGFDRWATSAVPLTQKLHRAGKFMDTLVAQQTVNEQLGCFAKYANLDFIAEAEYLRRKGIDSEDKKTVACLKSASRRSEARFWEFRGQAQEFGYTVKDRIGDYLKEDPENTADA